MPMQTLEPHAAPPGATGGGKRRGGAKATKISESDVDAQPPERLTMHPYQAEMLEAAKRDNVSLRGLRPEFDGPLYWASQRAQLLCSGPTPFPQKQCTRPA